MKGGEKSKATILKEKTVLKKSKNSMKLLGVNFELSSADIATYCG
jgi:hypothetical protein